jgi:hypothetical protein
MRIEAGEDLVPFIAISHVKGMIALTSGLGMSMRS